MKMLVVMDPSEERTSLTCSLAELGIEPVEAGGADAALAVLESGEEPAAVLLGWNLSGRDGIELLERLRADVRWQALPVLLVTGAEDLSRVSQALEAGVSEYLLQPLDSDSLLEKLLLLGVDPDYRKAA